MIVNGVVQPAARRAGRRHRPDDQRQRLITTRDDVLMRLNVALAKEALTLHVEGARRSGDPDRPSHRGRGGAFGERGGDLRCRWRDGHHRRDLLGERRGPCRQPRTYLAVGKDAKVTHITVDLSAPEAAHLRHPRVHGRRGRDAAHAGDPGRLGAEPDARSMRAFAGEGAHGDFTGLNLASDGQHHDITLEVSHAVPQHHAASRCSSRSRAGAARRWSRAASSSSAMRRRPTPS